MIRAAISRFRSRAFDSTAAPTPRDPAPAAARCAVEPATEPALSSPSPALERAAERIASDASLSTLPWSEWLAASAGRQPKIGGLDAP